MKLVITLLTVILFVSCGSDGGNVTSTSSSSSGIVSNNYNPVSAYHNTNYSFEEFKEKVSRGEFVKTGFPLSPNMFKYRYDMVEASGGCVYDWSGVAVVKFIAPASPLAITHQRIVENGNLSYLFDRDDDVVTSYSQVVEMLVNILENTRSVIFNIGTAYKVVTNDNQIFTIDLNKPLVANPTVAFDCESSSGFMFYRMQSYSNSWY